MRITTLLALFALAAIESAGTAAQAPVTARDQRVPVIVELFTSEGCSSCPPADKVLSQLIATQPVDGALIIGLSEHVDYWDRLGWKDPFSDARYTRRQNDYATHGTADNIYTPQMVVDGETAFVGSDRAAALAAVRKATTRPKRVVHLTWQSAGQLDIEIAAGNDRSASRVFLAVIEDGLANKVTRGENSGHTLPHDAVVRRLVELGQTTKEGAYHATIPVALDATWQRAATRVVVWTQRPGEAVSAVGQTSAAK